MQKRFNSYTKTGMVTFESKQKKYVNKLKI